jgi:ABC-type sugar transport system substrate-binding protein
LSQLNRRSLITRGTGFVGALALGPFLVACGSDDDSGDGGGAADDGKKQIAFGFPDQSFAGYPPQLKSIKEVAASRGYEILESHADSMLSRQVNEINTWIAQRVPAMIVLPLDENAIEPLVVKANEAGVKWIGYVDNKIPNMDGWVIFDNKHGGEVLGGYLGDWVNETLDGNAKAALLTHNRQQNGRQRINGAVAAMKGKAPDVEIVAQHEATFASEALPVAQSMLQANPDLNVFVCFTDDGCLGVLEAFNQTNPSQDRQDQMCIAGFDGTIPALEKIIDGTPVRATAATSIDTTSELCVEFSINAINGEGRTTGAIPTVLCAQTPDGLEEAKALLKRNRELST